MDVIVAVLVVVLPRTLSPAMDPSEAIGMVPACIAAGFACWKYCHELPSHTTSMRALDIKVAAATPPLLAVIALLEEAALYMLYMNPVGSEAVFGRVHALTVAPDQLMYSEDVPVSV